MNVFDIINWVTSKSLKTFDGIKEPLITFFSSPTFGDPSEQALKDSPQSMTELLRFIYAFNKADVNDLLWFFAQHHMAEEFVFVLSYCVYIGVLNNWVTPLNKGYDHFKAVSACLSYPIIQQVCSANLISNPKFKNMAGNLDQAEIQSRVAKLKASIFELRNTSFIDQIGLGDMKKKIELGGLTSLLNHNHCLEKLFTGELFKEYQKEVGLVLQSTLNPYDSEVLSKAIDRLKEVYLFRPDFAQEDLEKEVQKGSQATENLITSAYKMRQHWEGLKKHYLMEARSNARQENDSIASTILTEAENNKSLFDFMNVSSGEREQIVSFIYPTMIYMFIYLKSLKDVINPNENGARMSILRQSLNFIWKLFTTFKVRHSTNLDNIDRDPIAVLGIKDKEKKIDFLNRYAGMVYNLKIKKSNIYILKDLLRFAIKFIFYRAESKVKDKRFDELINNLKLDSFMELYDYLEEMDNSKEVSENYKENIVDMFVKFVNDPRFKKHVTDIKNIVKLAQGDMGKLHYFVDKLFTKSETVNFSHSGQLRKEQPAELRHYVGEGEVEQRIGLFVEGCLPKGGAVYPAIIRRPRYPPKESL
jgi:hypothetical protein